MIKVAMAAALIAAASINPTMAAFPHTEPPLARPPARAPMKPPARPPRPMPMPLATLTPGACMSVKDTARLVVEANQRALFGGWDPTGVAFTTLYLAPGGAWTAVITFRTGLSCVSAAGRGGFTITHEEE